jgi:predicted  nucleic acid-binding Zn-ribbon protein
VNSQLAPLVELQKIDLRIAEAKEHQRRIPERLASAAAPLREAQRVLSDATLAIERVTKERRSHEKDLEAHEERIGKMKDRAAQLKTNQEYQAHLFEVELANKKKGEIEEQILLAMEQIEQLQRQAKEAQSKVADAERLFTDENRLLEEENRRLAAQLAELEHKQQACVARVEKPLLDRYTKLKITRKDRALAAVKDGICLGCRLQLPPQLVAQVKRMQDLHTCPYCHRLLYWEADPSADGKPSGASDSDSDASPNLEVGESV